MEQLQGGRYVVVARYDQKSDNLTWDHPEIWLGDKVPQDRTIIRHALRMVNLGLYVSMVVLVVLGCLFAAIFIWFNFRYAHRR